jgi:hypothetical protein
MFFIIWTLDIFAETNKIITNIALLGIANVLLGILLLMTSIILYSIVSVVRERK